ncbi:MAG: transposase, partial [Deltaproteobacteria bacterium]|nr:transposase [Deltaproteobacteria bacterium]
LARESGISHLAKFADSLEAHRPGLCHYCLYPISTAKLEANNVTIGLIRKRARGYRDTEYFMLKIRQALS